MAATDVKEGYCVPCGKQYANRHGLNVHRYLKHTVKGRQQNNNRPRAKQKVDFTYWRPFEATPSFPNRKNETAATCPNFCPRCGEALTDEGRRTQRALGMLKVPS